MIHVSDGSHKLSQMLTTEEVSYVFGLRPSTVRRWGKQGILESYLLGNEASVRFKIADVVSFIKSARESSLSGTS
ncbi:helix-turn-helix domain-containing protein [Chloroflexota bacterium]